MDPITMKNSIFEKIFRSKYLLEDEGSLFNSVYTIEMDTDNNNIPYLWKKENELVDSLTKLGISAREAMHSIEKFKLSAEPILRKEK